MKTSASMLAKQKREEGNAEIHGEYLSWLCISVVGHLPSMHKASVLVVMGMA